MSPTGHGAAADETNLLYGSRSRAVSFTLTPSLILKHMFARADVSAVLLSHQSPGDGFRTAGEGAAQLRGLVEFGYIF